MKADQILLTQEAMNMNVATTQDAEGFASADHLSLRGISNPARPDPF
ncbi:hypothetical protein SAMN03097708_00815 [Thiohalomonas denitrificans]|uniref:Uncharacterized protein n=1 Tax=Thiohalomonas denitrificans TaxID=415747 RepID=A0A1G5PT87_9GAMM|nr:hypothetical protein SAMN03097708_00815 [Thiohalomonas denitrificans]